MEELRNGQSERCLVKLQSLSFVLLGKSVMLLQTHVISSRDLNLNPWVGAALTKFISVRDVCSYRVLNESLLPEHSLVCAAQVKLSVNVIMHALGLCVSHVPFCSKNTLVFLVHFFLSQVIPRLLMKRSNFFCSALVIFL